MSQVTVSKDDTVRVVPAELADRYKARGFKVEKVADQTSAKASAGQ
jgi:broad-specificity NMP kinase